MITMLADVHEGWLCITRSPLMARKTREQLDGLEHTTEKPKRIIVVYDDITEYMYKSRLPREENLELDIQSFVNATTILGRNADKYQVSCV